MKQSMAAPCVPISRAEPGEWTRAQIPENDEKLFTFGRWQMQGPWQSLHVSLAIFVRCTDGHTLAC